MQVYTGSAWVAAYVSGTGFAALSGATFTGDVTVPNLITSGNVDGRDVSVDGSKLDGIATGATANTGTITGVTAGTGLSGGGNSGSVTLSHADTSSLSGTYGSTTDGTKIDTITVDANGHITAVATGNTGDIRNISVGTGLDGGGSTGNVSITLDLSEFTDMTADMVNTDEFIVLDNGAERRKAANEIPLSIFNNDSGFTTNTGDITGVTAGTGLSGGGASGAVTLNVSGLTISELAANSLTTSSESFADNDTTLMTSAAINDRIESFGYTTNVGDITGVTAGSGLTGGGTSGTVTLNHEDTSSQASVNNSGRTYIQDVTLDTYGHVTGLVSATETVTDTVPNNATITLAAGTNLSGGGNFTTDQSSNETITFNFSGTIPTATSDLTNDSGFITSADGGNAQTLDSLDSTQFLRSDAADTKTSGDLTFSDDVKAVFGDGADLSIRHNGSNSIISDSGTGDLLIAGSQVRLMSSNIAENMIVATTNSAVELYHDNSKKLETTSTGATVTGGLTANVTGDGTEVLRLGTERPWAFLQRNTGASSSLAFRSTVDGKTFDIENEDGGIVARFISDNSDGRVALYYGNSQKFLTTSDGASITGDLTLTSTDAGATENPTLDLFRNSASPADGDVLGNVDFSGEDSAGNKTVYAKISADIADVTNGTEDGRLDIGVISAGSFSNRITLQGNGVTRFSNKDVELSNGISLRFEGSTGDANETVLTVTDPTADRTITLPDASGTVALTSDITGGASKGFAVAMAIAL